ALRWGPGTFTQQCLDMRTDLDLGVLGTWSVFPILEQTLASGKPFEGTVAELLKALNDRRKEAGTSLADWPKTPQTLGIELWRFAPALRSAGVRVEKLKRSGKGARVRLSLDRTGRGLALAG